MFFSGFQFTGFQYPRQDLQGRTIAPRVTESLMIDCYVWTVHALATINICLQMWRTSYIFRLKADESIFPDCQEVYMIWLRCWWESLQSWKQTIKAKLGALFHVPHSEKKGYQNGALGVKNPCQMLFATNGTCIWNKSDFVTWGYHSYGLLFYMAPLP